MAKYKNIYTGVIVEPSSDLAAQAFAKSPVWEEIKPKTPPKKAVKKDAGSKQK